MPSRSRTARARSITLQGDVELRNDQEGNHQAERIGPGANQPIRDADRPGARGRVEPGRPEVRFELPRIDPALQRLERQGLIKSTWGVSDLNRRARFYGLTRAGRKKLTAETGKWERMVRAIGRVMRQPGEEET